MNNNINLIGSKNHTTIPLASRKLLLMRAIAMVLLFGVSAASIILYILIAFSPLPQVQEQERQALSTISNSKSDMAKIALIQDRLGGISTIMKQRTTYDVLLDSVVSKMPPGITIFQITTNKKDITLTVRSSSLDALTTFVNNLTDAARAKEYAKITLNSILSDDESGMFSLTVSVGVL